MRDVLILYVEVSRGAHVAFILGVLEQFWRRDREKSKFDAPGKAKGSQSDYQWSANGGPEEILDSRWSKNRNVGFQRRQTEPKGTHSGAQGTPGDSPRVPKKEAQKRAQQEAFSYIFCHMFWPRSCTGFLYAFDVFLDHFYMIFGGHFSDVFG